jgi:hypothetical protein
MKARGTAVTITLIFAFFGSLYLFYLGISDLGILLGLLISILWLVPLWLLSIRALVVPENALSLMQVLAGFSIGLNFALLFFLGFLEKGENWLVTLVSVVVFVTAVVIGIWSWNFPKVGSQLLFAISAVSIISIAVVSELGSDESLNAATFAQTPALVCAGLFWISRPRMRKSLRHNDGFKSAL